LGVTGGDPGWAHVGELSLAFLLTSLIGLERTWRHKSAGLRTHTLVGVGAALFVIISKYGFDNVLGPDVILDPSRVAAQVVTGIGFLGGGLIFVRGDAVRGLTTAAIIWMTTAIGMACGAGLGGLAIVATAGHFLVVAGYPPLLGRLPHARFAGFSLRVVYADGQGILRDVLEVSTRRGYAILKVDTRRLTHSAYDVPAVVVTLELQGRREAEGLAVAISEIPGVLAVTTVDSEHERA
jgi:putative Mg2+ transporter-C (MgtC) family protein